MKIDKQLIIIFIIVLVTVIGAVIVMDTIHKQNEIKKVNYENKMVETCENLGLELLEYSKGNIFKESSIICFNKISKEIINIK